MNYKELLLKYNRKSITREKLFELFNTTDDEKLYKHIQNMEEDGMLEKIQSSATNGNFYFPIYDKYRILVKNEISEDEIIAIKNLNPKIKNKDYLIKKFNDYRQYSSQINDLDRYLFQKDVSEIAVSRKERSFIIFNEEKQLDDKKFCNLLKNIGLTKEDLNFYDTPEYCFNDYIPLRKNKLTLLILENKDIWFNVRRLMFESGCSEIFGTHIDGVVYGCGNQITENNALSQYGNFMSVESIDYLYWGDIDREGLNIYLRLINNNENLNISLFVPAYEAMLERSEDYTIPNSLDGRKLMGDYDCIYDLFDNSHKEILSNMIEQNKRLPQEIIDYAYLIEVMK